MKIQTISKQNFNGQMIIVDRFGKKANAELQRSVLNQLGSTVPELKRLIGPKSFDLFIHRTSTDYIAINANKTYAGIIRGETTFHSLHKSTIDQITTVAKTSIEEYEKFIQKHV